MDYIYHIITRTDWQNSLKVGFYEPESIHKEGFIHCSYASQVAGTAGRYYSEDKDLIVLKIETQKLLSEIRVEQGPNGDWFPHIYGPLILGAVVCEMPLVKDPTGRFQFSDLS